MKKYNIKVNGSTYEVEVEEVGVNAAPSVSPVVRPVAAAPVSTPAPAAPKAPAVAAPIAAGAQTITAPMPGTVLEVKVTPGQVVKAGDILIILEAMKMENEILAPSDGTIDTVQTTKGASVNASDILVTIK
nr:biotin/lipoyl-containing protein [uncultured Aminipila sp.]